MNKVLSHFGVGASDLLGSGGEAQVYGLDQDRVLRVCEEGADAESLALRNGLLDALDARDCGFAVPRVLDSGAIDDRLFVIEARIPGRSMDKVLAGLSGAKREDLLIKYFEAAKKVSGLAKPAPMFGDAARVDALLCEELHTFLETRVATSLAAVSMPVDPTDLAIPFNASTRPMLVHLDYFPANVMVSDNEISGVIDFGYSTIWADPDFTPVVAAVYLENRITQNAQPGDVPFARSWLRAEGLDHLFEPLRRWTCGYWAFCSGDDEGLFQYITSVLGCEPDLR